MNPYNNDKNAYSMWPITLSLLNLPNNICKKSSSILLVGIIPGPSEPKNLDPYLQCLVKEMTSFPKLDMIYDSYKKEQFHLQAKIVINILDYPGHTKVFHCNGEYGCMLYTVCMYSYNAIYM